MKIVFLKKTVSIIKTVAKVILPKPLLVPFRYFYKNFHSFCWFVFKNRYLSLSQRLPLIKKLYVITKNVNCPHREGQILSFINGIFSIPPDKRGCIVEAGAHKGGSTAKFSIAAKLANRKLVVFDSFEGLPKNEELHDKSILGHSIKGWFGEGDYCGTLEQVKSNVKKYGELEPCCFVKGWFADTMPRFSEPIVAIYLDVDLAHSTRICLKYLYPLLIPGGVLYSQDGDFLLVIEVFNNDKFWEQEVGCLKPLIEGLGSKKLIKINKPENL